MSLPGVEKGPVEGLYYVPIIYPIVAVVGFILLMTAVMYLSYKYPRAPFEWEIQEQKQVESKEVSTCGQE